MGKSARGAGEYTLQAITGEVTGLCAGINVGGPLPLSIKDIRQEDRLYGADLYTLTALDARGEILLLILCTRRT